MIELIMQDDSVETEEKTAVGGTMTKPSPEASAQTGLENLGVVNEAARVVGRTTGAESIAPPIDQAEIDKKIDEIRGSQSPEHAQLAEQAVEQALRPHPIDAKKEKVGMAPGPIPVHNIGVDRILFGRETQTLTNFTELDRVSITTELSKLPDYDPTTRNGYTPEQKYYLQRLVYARMLLHSINFYWAMAGIARDNRNSDDFKKYMRDFEFYANLFNGDSDMTQLIEDMPGVGVALTEIKGGCPSLAPGGCVDYLDPKKNVDYNKKLVGIVAVGVGETGQIRHDAAGNIIGGGFYTDLALRLASRYLIATEVKGSRFPFGKGPYGARNLPHVPGYSLQPTLDLASEAGRQIGSLGLDLLRIFTKF